MIKYMRWLFVNTSFWLNEHEYYGYVQYGNFDWPSHSSWMIPGTWRET
jgi:hypothetical protein